MTERDEKKLLKNIEDLNKNMKTLTKVLYDTAVAMKKLKEVQDEQLRVTREDIGSTSDGDDSERDR